MEARTFWEGYRKSNDRPDFEEWSGMTPSKVDEELHRLQKTDAMIAAIMGLYRHGEVAYIDALKAAIVLLSKERDELRRTALDLMEKWPCPPAS